MEPIENTPASENKSFDTDTGPQPSVATTTSPAVNTGLVNQNDPIANAEEAQPQVKPHNIVGIIFVVLLLLSFLLQGAGSFLFILIIPFGIVAAILFFRDTNRSTKNSSTTVRIFSVLATIGITCVILIIGVIAFFFIALENHQLAC